MSNERERDTFIEVNQQLLITQKINTETNAHFLSDGD